MISFKISQIDTSKLDVLKNWSVSYNLEKILVALKNEMSSPVNKKLWQPPEGTSFF